MRSLFLFTICLTFLTYLTSACSTNNTSPWQSQCFTFFNTPNTFDDAEAACMQLGGHLVSIHDGFTNAFISQEAAKYINAEDFWIGTNSSTTGMTWNWTDGSTFDFMDWKTGEPSYAGSCGAFALKDGYWSAQNCSATKPFVCAVADTNTTVPPPPTPSTSSPCEDGWKYFGSSNACYLLFNQSEVEQWQPAEDVCVQNGAHLASLHSQDEAMFVLGYEDQTGYAFWIGLITDDKGATWKWSDGTPTDYMPWRQGFPYPFFDYDTCGLLMEESKEDVTPVYENLECSFSQPFMCKKQL